MNYFNRAASAGYVINEGLRDLTEERHLEVVAKRKEQQRRRHIVSGFYPDNPTKRMPLSLHREHLDAIEATSGEWRDFQDRTDLAHGFNPVTGVRLTREQHAESIKQLDLTQEDLREIGYWASLE